MPSIRAIFLFLNGLILLYPALAQSPQTYAMATYAGNGTAGFSGDGAAANAAQLSGPAGLWVDGAGNLYIADQFNHRLRKVDAGSRNISTIAGNGTMGFAGDNAAATSADLNTPGDVVVDSAGNIYIADTGNDVIRKVTSGGTISTFAGNYGAGFNFGGDGGAASGAVFNTPSAVVLDSSGNLYIADTVNNRIRKVSASNNIVTTLAGQDASGFAGDNGRAIFAKLNAPRGLAVDASGNLYIADSLNHRIRKVTPAGIISTVVGSGTPGFSGDGGPALNAQLNRPLAITLDAAGNMYIADSFNSRIRKVSSSGIITTIAGNGSFGYNGDGYPATSFPLKFPSGVAVDGAGNVYIGDTQNNAVRLLTPQAPPSPPSVSANGVISAGSFGAFSSAAPGSWIEIYGTNLAVDSRPWATSDFNGFTAPISLDGTGVTIGGVSAFLSYISANQINAQVPSGAGSGPQPLVVTTAGGASAPYSLTLNTAQPGLYAPPSFQIGGKQYVAALFSDGTYVAPPGVVSGITSRQAHPGETVLLYGVGFGLVTPGFAAGQIAQQSNTLAAPLKVFFGQSQATLSYQGLAPGFVGLYQFNVVVPNIPSSDAVPLTFTLGGVQGSQTLYTAVQD